MEHWSTRWLGLFYHQLCTQNWTRFFWYSSARVWSIFKMDTHMDGSVLAVLAAYQNNLVTSKMMTSQVAQWFPTSTSGKYNSWRERVKVLLGTECEQTRTTVHCARVPHFSARSCYIYFHLQTKQTTVFCKYLSTLPPKICSKLSFYLWSIKDEALGGWTTVVVYSEQN